MARRWCMATMVLFSVALDSGCILMGGGGRDGGGGVNAGGVDAGGLDGGGGTDASAVNAGDNQTVSVGADVTLTGTVSPDGGSYTYAWTQTAGPTVSLTGANTATAAFSPGEVGTYSFLLTVIDAGSDTVNVTAQGIQSGNFYVDVFYKNEVATGKTLFFDQVGAGGAGGAGHFRLVELNMRGEVVWQYVIPSAYLATPTIGYDVEKLENGNYLFLTGTGIYEVSDAGALRWSYATTKVSHDVQRLPNGDTFWNFGNSDGTGDAQMRRVNDAGVVVWSWYAKDHIPADGVWAQGWTHANAVLWQSKSSVFINLRNQYKTLEINVDGGNIVWEMDWSIYGTDVDPHEPDILANGNMLICLQNDAPHVAVEIDRTTKAAVWTYTNTNLRTTRDCDRLPNGNTLIVAVDKGGTNNTTADDYSTMLEVNDAGKTVWRMTANKKPVGSAPGYFYKAERLTTGWTPFTTAD